LAWFVIEMAVANHFSQATPHRPSTLRPPTQSYEVGVFA